MLFQTAALYVLARQTNHTPVILVGDRTARKAYVTMKTLFPNLVICVTLEVLWLPIIKFQLTSTHENNVLNLIPNTSVIIEGYFQSWKYLLPFEDELRVMLQLDTGLLQSLQTKLQAIERQIPIPSPGEGGPIFVGLHVRRGDLLQQPAMKEGFKLSGLNYISKAMDYFRKRYPTSQFVVRSDDIKWCRENIRGSDVHLPLETGHSISYNMLLPLQEAVADLALLSLCNHTIITVGTFGWWAAFLADGETVYYKDAYKHGSNMDIKVNPSDFYMPHWKGFS